MMTKEKIRVGKIKTAYYREYIVSFLVSVYNTIFHYPDTFMPIIFYCRKIGTYLA